MASSKFETWAVSDAIARASTARLHCMVRQRKWSSGYIEQWRRQAVEAADVPFPIQLPHVCIDSQSVLAAMIQDKCTHWLEFANVKLSVNAGKTYSFSNNAELSKFLNQCFDHDQRSGTQSRLRFHGEVSGQHVMMLSESHISTMTFEFEFVLAPTFDNDKLVAQCYWHRRETLKDEPEYEEIAQLSSEKTINDPLHRFHSAEAMEQHMKKKRKKTDNHIDINLQFEARVKLCDDYDRAVLAEWMNHILPDHSVNVLQMVPFDDTVKVSALFEVMPGVTVPIKGAPNAEIERFQDSKSVDDTEPSKFAGIQFAFENDATCHEFDLKAFRSHYSLERFRQVIGPRANKKQARIEFDRTAVAWVSNMIEFRVAVEFQIRNQPVNWNQLSLDKLFYIFDMEGSAVGMDSSFYRCVVPVRLTWPKDEAMSLSSLENLQHVSFYRFLVNSSDDNINVTVDLVSTGTHDYRGYEIVVPTLAAPFVFDRLRRLDESIDNIARERLSEFLHHNWKDTKLDSKTPATIRLQLTEPGNPFIPELLRCQCDEHVQFNCIESQLIIFAASSENSLTTIPRLFDKLSLGGLLEHIPASIVGQFVLCDWQVFIVDANAERRYVIKGRTKDQNLDEMVLIYNKNIGEVTLVMRHPELFLPYSCFVYVSCESLTLRQFIHSVNKPASYKGKGYVRNQIVLPLIVGAAKQIVPVGASLLTVSGKQITWAPSATCKSDAVTCIPEDEKAADSETIDPLRDDNKAHENSSNKRVKLSHNVQYRSGEFDIYPI